MSDHECLHGGEIHSKLNSIQTDMKITSRAVSEMQVHLATHMAHQERTAEDLTGLRKQVGGHNGTPGLTVRIDRLEQVQESRKWALRTMGAALVAMVAKLLTFGGKG